MSELFSKSENFKQEYCCSIVRIGEVVPIEGSDFLGKTIVDGFSMVIRKDEVKEGDIMFYCENETQLNKNFLAINNLFEISARELNLNYSEVQELIDKEETDKAKSMVGFFNKHGRVKMIKLRGCPSMGFLFGLKALTEFNPKFKNIDLEQYVGTDFDMVDGVLFIKAYVPEVNVNNHVGGGRGAKATRKLTRYDRMVDGQFKFHYDTAPLQKNMHCIKPNDIVTISVKLHGTSIVVGNVLTKIPYQINTKCDWFNRVFNSFYLRLPKWMQSTHEGYDLVYSSRTVIKNQYINPNVTEGFYNVDIWGEYAKRLEGKIPEGMTIYGEIVGYMTGSQSMIQKNFDYGCAEGTNKLMIYRISTKMEDGKDFEWNVLEVEEWTRKLVFDYPELSDYIHPIDVLYNGTLMSLYPNIDIGGHWHENILEKMKVDEEHFGMEKNEPLCKIKVPREGVVLRIDNDAVNEAFKLKTVAFLQKEAKDIDNGSVDIEMQYTYCNE